MGMCITLMYVHAFNPSWLIESRNTLVLLPSAQYCSVNRCISRVSTDQRLRKGTEEFRTWLFLAMNIVQNWRFLYTHSGNRPISCLMFPQDIVLQKTRSRPVDKHIGLVISAGTCQVLTPGQVTSLLQIPGSSVIKNHTIVFVKVLSISGWSSTI